MSKSNSRRLREQRERQQVYRDEQRELRRPSRDDIARVFLWRMLRKALKADGTVQDWMQDMVVGDLVRQGFDEAQSDRAFEDLFDRYASTSSPPFRRKLHLR